MNRRFVLWHEWRKAYWKGAEKFPELFAFLHRTYVLQYEVESGQLSMGDVLFNPIVERIKGGQGKKVSGKEAVLKAPEGVNFKNELEVNRFKQADLLFLAHSHRDTCLGVGEKLFKRIHQRKLTISGSYYQSIRQLILPESIHEGVPIATLSPQISIKGIFRFFVLVPVMYVLGMRSFVVARFIVFHPIITLTALLKITMLTECIRDMLFKIRPKVVLAPNEQGGGDISVVFAVARDMGIRTIQYLHGSPTRQFVPFICDEYWSWSELTTTMLLGVESDIRVKNIGCLEHQVRNRSKPRVAEYSQHGERRILFLSQVAMDEAWGIGAVAAGVNIFKKGILDFSDPIVLRIRAHPNSNEKQFEQIATLFSGITYELSTKEVPLMEDVKWATHVYSVSSNAIFAALLGGKPAYLFWNDELSEIYGRCFLLDENVISTKEEFLRSLESDECIEESAQTLTRVLGSSGSLDRAVDRIQQLLESC